MHDYDVEEYGEDIGAGIAVCYAFSRVWRWCPGWAEDARLDRVMDLGSVWFGVGAEELCVELRKYVADPVCFIRELDTEQCLEEGEKLWGYLCLKSGHVGEGQKETDRLVCVSGRYRVNGNVAYLFIGVDPTPVVTTLVVLLVDSKIITLDLKLRAQSLPAFLRTFNHSA